MELSEFFLRSVDLLHQSHDQAVRPLHFMRDDSLLVRSISDVLQHHLSGATICPP